MAGRPKFARRNVVRSVDVFYPTLAELPIGALTCEGIVLATSLFDHTYTTPAGEFAVDREDQSIAVFATCDEDIVEATQERVALERARA